MRTRAFLLSVLVACGLGPTPALSGQSVLSASLSGTVRRTDGGTVSQALVTLTSLDLGFTRETTSSAGGEFSFAFIEPGTYELRVEALGFRPLLAGPAQVTGSQHSSVALALEPASDLVTAVDTTALDLGAGGFWRQGGLRLSPERVAELPTALDDLASVAALSSRMDATLGSQGLPGSLSTLVVDGVPFPLASHPAQRSASLPNAALTRKAISSLDVLGNPPDVEHGGSAAAIIAPASRASVRDGGSVLTAGWSGDPLWSSSELTFDAPTLLSYWASAAATVELSPDTSRLFVTGEAMQRETPLAARLTPEVASSMNGLGDGVAAQLSSPTIERLTRTSGAARLDWLLGPTKRFMLRADAGRATREFDPIAPALGAGGGEAAEEATDFSVAGAVTTEYDRGLALEFRGGISGSDRTYGGGFAGLPATTLPLTGFAFGGGAGADAAARRLDAHLSPVVHYRIGPGTAKAGVQVRATKHTLSYAGYEGPGYALAGPTGPGAGGGVAVGSGSAPESSFSTTELSVFGQYSWDPAPGVRFNLGARFDYEVLPSGEATLNAEWLAASGVRNDEHPSDLRQVGGVASLVWDVAGDGRTQIEATASQFHGDLDPWLLHEVYSRQSGAAVTRFAGSGIGWPGPSLPSGSVTAPALSLMGPDSRAPRSTRVGAGLTHRFEGGWTLHLGAISRRTDFLARRRDLNVAVLPVGVDANGRDLVGDLAKLGSVIAADPGTNRRFPAFDRVWALDYDGWSEYRGGTVGLEYSGANADLFATYTRSQTRDNWIGARAGVPDAQLDPRLPDGADWAEGISDYDVPDRLAAGATFRVGPSGAVSLSAVYRYESGLPFTTGYRPGVDVNGDGSWHNDVAWVPQVGELAGLASAWPCLDDDAGGFAVRNACRGPARHSLDARIRARVGRLGGRAVELVVDGYGLIENDDGLRDTALWIVDPTRSLVGSPGSGTVTIPLTVNPEFGNVLVPSGRGRMLRVGFRIGGGS